MSYEVSPKARCARSVALFVLLGALLAPLAAKADPPAPLNVLFVANGWCSQEDDIENHLLDLGYTVTRMKDYKVKGTTSFTAYDLIVLTESAPLVSPFGMSAIKASGKPVLVVESWTFLYAYRLGLTTSAVARLSYGDTVTSLVEGYTAFTSRVGAEALVYQPEALAFGVNPDHVKSSVSPLYQSTGCMSGVAVFADYAKKIAVTGVAETGSYTVDGNGRWEEDPDYPDSNLHWYYAWRAPLSHPQSGDFASLTPLTTNTAGYGAYIIDAFSDSEYTGEDIVLWHTISVGQGTVDTPYGVYSGSEAISW